MVRGSGCWYGKKHIFPPSFFSRILDNTIYCIGGIGGKGGTYEKRLDTVECLELGEEGGKRWKQLASMSTPRSSHTCEVMDGLIYVVGGGDGKDWLCSAEVQI